MPMNFVAAFRDWMFGAEEKRLVVWRPLNAADALERVFEQFSSLEILDVKCVLAIACCVGRIRKQFIIIADCEGPDTEKLVAFRQFVHVKNHFLRRVESLLAAMNWVVSSFLRAAV